MSMILECKESADFVPHPEGIHPAVCVDVIDLGMVETEFQGQKRIVPKLKLVFESEQKTDDGRSCVVSRRFTASLHPKARLAEFIGKWRGRPVVPGESIDLSKLIGACCTLVISHQQNPQGRTFASIDAVSKPTKRLKASGGYDPAAARQRMAEWNTKQSGAAPQRGMQPAPTPQPSGGGARPPKSGAPVAAAAPEFDPEVGF
jgi:hypothetical protein